jgi:hypothetical protein
MDPTKFGAVPLDKPKRLNYMRHLEEHWQDQYAVKHPRESQVVHLGVVEETSHSCSLHLLG